MPKYNFTALVTLSIHTEIEANNYQEAFTKAKLREQLVAVVGCNGDTKEDVWMLDFDAGLEGVPFNVQEE
tara:strand:- start:110 stop:319 length:210 start_codon:yes stop_codon:yes gene_type:complete